MEFTKLQGIGNDFLVTVVDDVSSIGAINELARGICDRHFGAGADGLIVADCRQGSTADFRSRIFNADGGEAEVSGNGTRCLAAYLYYSGLWALPDVRISTAAGVKTGRLVSYEGLRYEFEFNMGKPILASREIPVEIEPPSDRVVGYKLVASGTEYEITCTSMGNPHCSIMVQSLSDKVLGEIGPLIESHPFFPNHTNVEFVRVVSNEEIEVRFWERGVGWTNSSGTGSCAATVSSALLGLTGRSVTVRTAGGELKVRWSADDQVYLTGAAEVVYQGNWLASNAMD
jgi:diaminopimelate epimerase